MKFLEHDIRDKVFLRYINRFLISGYMEDMKYYETDKGTPQGYEKKFIMQSKDLV